MRKYLILTTILCFAIISEIFGQVNPCITEDIIEFNTQQEVDNFPSNYPNYTQISESIVIDDNSGVDNITNLDSLYQITSIAGTLHLIGSTITDFSGLENLNSIGGCLRLDFPYNLVSFSGLENLNSIGGDFTITDPTNLVSLSGLENLNSIGGELYMSSCFELTNIAGLENLNSIGGNLRIEGNDELVSLSGLENLTSVGGDLYISGNGSVADFSGLENLNSVGGGIYISGNDMLTDISGLENINHTDITQLSIKYNSTLSLCGVESICKYLVNGGATDIENNAEGCNTVEEIVESCASLFEYTIEGNVFLDNNADCLQDSDEPGLDNWIIKIEGGISALRLIPYLYRQIIQMAVLILEQPATCFVPC